MKIMLVMWGLVGVSLGCMFLWWAALCVGSWLGWSTAPHLTSFWLFIACSMTGVWYLGNALDGIEKAIWRKRT